MTKEEIAKLTLKNIDQLLTEQDLNSLTEEDIVLIQERMQADFLSRVEIHAVAVENVTKHLKSTGESRGITVSGTSGVGFTITIKDSSGCSIMEEELENVRIPSNGKYYFLQEFPSIKSTLKEQHYEIILTPHADVEYDYSGDNIILKQYSVTTLTFTTKTTASSTSTPVESITKVAVGAVNGSDLVFTGEGNNGATNTKTVSVTESSASDGFFYVKNRDFAKANSSGSVIKKVVNRSGPNFRESILNLKPLTTGTKNDIESGDLVGGMRISGSVKEIKTVTNSLEVPDCKRKTDKFELENTTGLFEGMFLVLNNAITASIVSVDCQKNITVSKKLVIRTGTKASFEYKSQARVRKVIAQVNSAGEACVEVDRSVYIPNGMILEFDDDTSSYVGTVTATGSGTNTIALTEKIQVRAFGTYDVTYVLDLSSLITRKPNIKDRVFETNANSSSEKFNLSQGDNDSNKIGKQYRITKAPSHGSVIIRDAVGDGVNFPNLVYTPNPGFVGEEILKYRVDHDGTSALTDDDTAVNPMSDEKTIRITVK
tara:strand:+ start:478 stop:2106 length:1629 start_codon:yes stop_codon:yes gene_type:complete